MVRTNLATKIFSSIHGNPQIIGNNKERIEAAEEAGLSFIKINFIGRTAREGMDKGFRGFQFATVFEDHNHILRYELTKDAEGKDCASPDKVRFYQCGVRKNRNAYVVDTDYNRTYLAKMVHTEPTIRVEAGKIANEIIKIAEKYPAKVKALEKKTSAKDFLKKLATKKAELALFGDKKRDALRSKARKAVEEESPEIVAEVKLKCNNPDKYWLDQEYKLVMVPLIDSKMDEILMEESEG